MTYLPIARVAGMVVVVMVAAAGPSGLLAQTAGVPPPAVLAKARLTEAIAGAKQWKPDAVLIQVVSRNVSADGKTIMWDYGFWSPSAKGCAIVNVAANGRSAAEPSGKAECESPTLTEFMDSDKAFAIARANGVTAARVTMAASIATVRGVKGAVWAVMDETGMKPGNVMLDINATTGAVLSKTSQR